MNIELIDKKFDYDLLKAGHPMRRKGWKGYWAYESKTIMMVCVDGRVVDIRNSVDMDYTMTNMVAQDWELVDETDVVKTSVRECSEGVYELIDTKMDIIGEEIRCELCGQEIEILFDSYNFVEAVKNCKCRTRLVPIYRVDLETRRYLDDCEIYNK